MNDHPCIRELMTKEQRRARVVVFCERFQKHQQCIDKSDSENPQWAIFKECGFERQP